jgi:hypothetical protein
LSAGNGRVCRGDVVALSIFALAFDLGNERDYQAYNWTKDYEIILEVVISHDDSFEEFTDQIITL